MKWLPTLTDWAENEEKKPLTHFRGLHAYYSKIVRSKENPKTIEGRFKLLRQGTTPLAKQIEQTIDFFQ